jgi:hypothetical protein
MTIATGLAWESGNWVWNQFGHGLGQFLISPGLAGGAAVMAAYLAARQVQATREQDRTTKQLEGLWKRFEWVVDRSTPKEQWRRRRPRRPKNHDNLGVHPRVGAKTRRRSSPRHDWDIYGERTR